MKITPYKVTEIRSSTEIYKPSQPLEIYDEGNFYRIDSTYIIDKYRIKSMSLDGDKQTIHLNDEDVVLTIIGKK